jgi:hypothetical protein
LQSTYSLHPLLLSLFLSSDSLDVVLVLTCDVWSDVFS